jgi:hypothetical protein
LEQAKVVISTGCERDYSTRNLGPCRQIRLLTPSLYSDEYIDRRHLMTVALRFDPWTLRSRNGATTALHGKPIISLPPRMIEPELDELQSRASRRTRVWELSNHVHCSIVGTCLSTGELRQVLSKAGMAVDGASDHDLHGQGVLLANLRDGRGKLLHKALDKRHRLAIGRFEKAKTIDAVRALWRDAVKQGDIPGGYWAALTHPAANDALIREIFGEVHMLSHLVGAANRADIRRLSELEAENAALREKLIRQQDHLRDGITARDARIRELSNLLASRIADQAAQREDGASDEATLSALIASLEQRLRSETNRRAAVEERLARANDELSREREQRGALQRRERALSEELEAFEAGFELATEDGPPAAPSSLAGLTLLYVGGRTDKLGHLRASSERLGARFLHHDGGVDDRSGLLGGLVSRADVVMFPVDCVSHAAVGTVKRLCRQMSKPFVPLRSTGMGSFVAALSRTTRP